MQKVKENTVKKGKRQKQTSKASKKKIHIASRLECRTTLQIVDPPHTIASSLRKVREAPRESKVQMHARKDGKGR